MAAGAASMMASSSAVRSDVAGTEQVFRSPQLDISVGKLVSGGPQVSDVALRVAGDAAADNGDDGQVQVDEEDRYVIGRSAMSCTLCWKRSLGRVASCGCRSKTPFTGIQHSNRAMHSGCNELCGNICDFDNWRRGGDSNSRYP